MTSLRADVPAPAHIDWLGALPILAGLAALYGPTYARLSGGLWQAQEQLHAPLTAVVAVALFWRLRHALANLMSADHAPAGVAVLGLGLTMAIAGAGVDSHFLVMLSQIPVLASVLLLMLGGRGLRLAWFPLAFLVYMVPLPGILIDAMTSQLKEWISILVEELLYGLGYPVARNGVVITVGQYRLLIADACSGLHSLVSLSALGSLFIYLMGRTSLRHNLIMAASILPIAFVANLIRVLLLALLTYHLGDATGQLLHEMAGVTVFVCALLLLFSLDGLLDRGRNLITRPQP